MVILCQTVVSKSGVFVAIIPKIEKEQLTMPGFILKFMEYVRDAHDINSFPAYDSRPWHEWLWALKEKLKAGLPFEVSRFNWDGAYPRNPELSEFMVIGVRNNCGQTLDGRIHFQPLLLGHYLDHDYPSLAGAAFEIAKGIEGFFEE